MYRCIVNKAKITDHLIYVREKTIKTNKQKKNIKNFSPFGLGTRARPVLIGLVISATLPPVPVKQCAKKGGQTVFCY